MENDLNYKKNDFNEQLKNIAVEFLRFINENFFEHSSFFNETVNENVLDLLNVEKPRVMVYGIYNSGKSTLINALCKKEVAKMADRPMTAKISEYDRGDYCLIDSPGVDAPIEHERVTEEYLNKCHVILFVISSKGLFEDRSNYQRLAELVAKDIPFIIVLNERGVEKKNDLPKEEKKRIDFEHDQELKTIQNKIIKNLSEVSHDDKIAEKYEVVVLNAKKALKGILEGKPGLYDISNVSFLEKRIMQLINSKSSFKTLFSQPIYNLKECFNQAEKIVAQNLSGNDSEDFGKCMDIIGKKRDNLTEDLRIMTRQTVGSHLEELTNAYAGGDNILDAVVMSIQMEVESQYEAKTRELSVYVERHLKSLNLFSNEDVNLDFRMSGGRGDKLPEGDLDFERESPLAGDMPMEKKGFFDLLKSRKKREKEKQERLQREAEIKNQQAQYRVQEQIRKRQEARQLASSDLDDVYREVSRSVTEGLEEQYETIVARIQEVDNQNRQLLEEGKQQMARLKEMRGKLRDIENAIA